MLNNYDFINHINYQITENNRYSHIRLKEKIFLGLMILRLIIKIPLMNNNWFVLLRT